MSDKATYQHSPQHYAKLYNVTERTIYRWIDDGLPLDDADAILLAKGKPAAENETVPQEIGVRQHFLTGCQDMTPAYAP